jgi:hypothetical protein
LHARRWNAGSFREAVVDPAFDGKVFAISADVGSSVGFVCFCNQDFGEFHKKQLSPLLTVLFFLIMI